MNKLSTKTRCAACNKKRPLQMDNIISVDNGILNVYNKCPHCESAFLAVISNSKDGGLVVVETLTDLTKEEAMEMSKRPVLTADAVLDVYNLIGVNQKSYDKR
jgi:formate dehydrogenase maturation protein FdhE